MRNVLAVAVLLLLAGCSSEPKSAKDVTCGEIHKPKAGCFPGWTEHPGVFTEKDGTKVSSCTAPQGADVRESQEVDIPIPVAVPEQDHKKGTT